MTDLIECGIQTNKKGQPVVSSRKIAEIFEKEHKDVLDAIRSLYCSKDFGRRNFTPSEYLNEQCKKQPEYLITKDGFTFLAMGFTGEKAARFKEAYINAFNSMERTLKDRARLRGETKQVRHAFTDTLKEHGYKKPVEYAFTTSEMRKALNVPAGTRDELPDIELMKLKASETIARINILQTDANGFNEVHPVCVDSGRLVEQATRKRIGA